MLEEQLWLARATRFSLGVCPIYKRNVSIESRDQLDGSRKWVLKMDSWVLGKDGIFIYEPLPSSRTDDFIANTRYDTKEACYASWVSVTEEQPLYLNL